MSEGKIATVELDMHGCEECRKDLTPDEGEVMSALKAVDARQKIMAAYATMYFLSATPILLSDEDLKWYDNRENMLKIYLVLVKHHPHCFFDIRFKGFNPTIHTGLADQPDWTNDAEIIQHPTQQ
jgi:hypothetical protein